MENRPVRTARRRGEAAVGWGVRKNSSRHAYGAAVGQRLGVARLVLALGLLLPAARARGEIIAKPGDFGTIEFQLNNKGAAGSNRRLEEVQLSVVPPANFPLVVTSIKIKEDDTLTQPITIEPGQTRTFVISYQLGQTIDDGTYPVALNVQTLNEFTEPAPGAYNAVVIFTTKPGRFSLDRLG